MMQSVPRRQLLAELAQRGGLAIRPQHHRAASSRLLGCTARPLSSLSSFPRTKVPSPPAVARHCLRYNSGPYMMEGEHRTYFQPPPPPKPSFIVRALKVCGLLAIGAVFAAPSAMRLFTNDWGHVQLRGEPIELNLRASLQDAGAKHPLVQALLANPDWSERHHDAYECFSPIEGRTRDDRLTTCASLGSAYGIGGYQHVFHNKVTHEVLAVVFIGRHTTGWPHFVHGGLLATLLDEHCARAAMDDPVFGTDDQGIVTARLELNYRSKTSSSDFYVLKARAVPEHELDEKERGKRDRKVWVESRVLTLGGKICVDGRALYVKPSGTNLRAVGRNF